MGNRALTGLPPERLVYNDWQPTKEGEKQEQNSYQQFYYNEDYIFFSDLTWD